MARRVLVELVLRNAEEFRRMDRHDGWGDDPVTFDTNQKLRLAARRDIDPEVDAADALDRGDHLEHRGAAAIAAVEGGARAAAEQMR